MAVCGAVFLVLWKDLLVLDFSLNSWLLERRFYKVTDEFGLTS